MARRQREPVEPTYWERAPEVARIADQVVTMSHPRLKSERIEYIFRSRAQVRDGRALLGVTSKVMGKTSFLASGLLAGGGEFFVVEVAKDLWHKLNETQREALVDSLLCSLGKTVRGRPTIHRPDFEGYLSNLAGYGPWQADLQKMLEVGRRWPGAQQSLALDESDADVDPILDGANRAFETAVASEALTDDASEALTDDASEAPPVAASNGAAGSDEARALARQFDCPRCHSPAGRACVTVSGRLVAPHKERVARVAVAA